LLLRFVASFAEKMQGEDSTFGKFKAGNVDIAIDDVSAIGTHRPSLLQKND